VIAGRAVVGRAAALVWAVALVWVVAQLGSKPVMCNYFFYGSFQYIGCPVTFRVMHTSRKTRSNTEAQVTNEPTY